MLDAFLWGMKCCATLLGFLAPVFVIVIICDIISRVSKKLSDANETSER